ncbi:Uncharacterised protein [Mycobacterium tuberculosis]|nr:Uncharacterised protein [Mycobacterium tuberculosis]
MLVREQNPDRFYSLTFKPADQFDSLVNGDATQDTELRQHSVADYLL